VPGSPSRSQRSETTDARAALHKPLESHGDPAPTNPPDTTPKQGDFPQTCLPPDAVNPDQPHEFSPQDPRVVLGVAYCFSRTMRFLSFSECVNWCSERRISTPTGDRSHAPAIEEPEFYFADLPYDIDSGRKVACAEHLYSLVEPSPETLLWLTAWSVWPSSQHMPLFDRFRQSLG
jgi:hypothetical protein